MATPAPLSPGLAAAVARLFPGARILGADAVGADDTARSTGKAEGYAAPVRVTIQTAVGENRCIVVRTAKPDEFGHDRRADRAAELLLAFDTFNTLPGHVRALDVGAFAAGELRSLRDAGEFYLVTAWVDGEPYAESLRRVARRGTVTGADLARVDELVGWLAALHAERVDDRRAWRRAVRDLVGSGEGIMGIVDAYPPETPGAPPAVLRDVERLASEWRWRLRDRGDRLRRIHGDFHPFNLVFDEGCHFTPLDASRGCVGDPADDLTALSVNFPFFALERPASWREGLGALWHRFWRGWLEATGDAEVMEVAPPFFAWRALVVACPRFYPRVPAAARERLLALAGDVLQRGFHLDAPEALFR
jgi:hypothetical protein